MIEKLSEILTEVRVYIPKAIIPELKEVAAQERRSMSAQIAVLAEEALRARRAKRKS